MRDILAMQASRGLGLVLFVLAGCASHDAFRLVHPPAEQAADFPGGYRLLTKAPLDDWQVVGRFASRTDCEQARQAATDRTIDHARATLGADAKNDLDVRRAVNARCVVSVRLEAAER